MRLLNTESLLFEEFFGTQVPKYAILSHRWGDDEVTLQDFRKGRKRNGQGHAKIMQCCALAKGRGFQWVWIDTCCIDKKSSAELSEAINSMYRWYDNAGECYAYLSDVKWSPHSLEQSRISFAQSLWFTRGWTLQELLAPSFVIFFDREWRDFGTKSTLATEISTVTGIKHDDLYSRVDVCIATKMSWVSRRVTSRIEDMAYCMLGLFDVNMPLLYGEGEKAFVRLQLEIIKKSDDESIFAWTTSSDDKPGTRGMLALSPTAFTHSSDIFRELRPPRVTRPPYQMTNQGLELQVPSKGGKRRGELSNLPDSPLSLALNCRRIGPNGQAHSVTITLTKIQYWGFWRRIECDWLGSSERAEDSSDGEMADGRVKQTAIYVRQDGL